MKLFRLITLGTLSIGAWLPAMAEPYQGHNENASWRIEAAKRIEKYRKTDLTVRVIDAAGEPVAGATVSIEQQSHAFPFGTAVNARLLLKQNPDSEAYRNRIVELFNTATIENGLKWHRWEAGAKAGYSKSQTVAAIDWLRANDFKVRGHVFVWPSEKYLPKDLLSKTKAWMPSSEDQQYVRDRIAKHIEELGSATSGKLAAWDVVNEPRKNHLLMDYLPEGNSAMADWFRLAKQAAPNSKLYLNEYGILDGGRIDTPDQKLLVSHLQGLVDAKAPFDGVGLQSHFYNEKSITPPKMLWQILDQYAAIANEIQITEFDFNTENEQLQADYLRDFMTATFAHPSVSAITLWGFWEGAHWRPQAALYRKDWTIKPNGKAFVDLVYRDWWSEEEVRTDELGEAAKRVFQGDYTIVTSYEGQCDERDVSVGRQPTDILVRLKND